MARTSAATPPRTAAGDALSLVAVQLIQLGGLLSEAGDAMAKPAGQTSARWQVLAGIEHAPTTVASVARRLGLARQSVQRVADLVERDGLAVYEDNPGHRRAKLLRITPAGASALATIQEAQRAWANELGEELGEKDLRQTGATLEQLLAALRRRSGRGGHKAETGDGA